MKPLTSQLFMGSEKKDNYHLVIQTVRKSLNKHDIFIILFYNNLFNTDDLYKCRAGSVEREMLRMINIKVVNSSILSSHHLYLWKWLMCRYFILSCDYVLWLSEYDTDTNIKFVTC